MPFIYVFVSQLFTVIHSGISGGGRGQGGAAGEQLRERAAVTAAGGIFSFSPPEAFDESETEATA